MVKIDFKNKTMYKDLYSGFYHIGLKETRYISTNPYMWSTYFKINTSLVNYFHFLANKKITDDDAKKLFVMIPRINSLIEEGYTIDQIATLYNSDEITTKKYIKK